MATPPPEIVEAVGRILRADPSRARSLADALRAPGRSFDSTVSGGSMMPGLAPGTRIRIALVPGAPQVPGEIVAYLSGAQVVVHRMLHRGRAAAARGHVLTIGDATLVPDPPVPQARLLGAVTGVWRGGAWTPPPAAPRRSFRARLARSICIAAALCVVYVSPRAAGRALMALHRTTGAVRAAMARHRRRGRTGAPSSAE